MKKYGWIAAVLMILLLTSCTGKAEQSISENKSAQMVKEVDAEEIPAMQTDEPAFSSDSKESAAADGKAQDSTKAVPESTSESEQPVRPVQQEDAPMGEPAALPKPTDPEPSEQPKLEETLSPAPSASEPTPEITPEPSIPTESEPPEETAPPVIQAPESEPESVFDIDIWISYAKNYAQGLGLLLNSEAVYCWDNPIGANAGCVYLERDIQSRLNRYAGDEDITDVWIWAEETSTGNYELYIGYA